MSSIAEVLTGTDLDFVENACFVLLVALVGALPLIASGTPLPALSIEVADLAAPYLAAAGVAALGVLGWRGRCDPLGLLAQPGRAVLAALLGLLAWKIGRTPASPYVYDL